MTIIGTEEEIQSLKSKCDGRCVDGEWCIFGDDSNYCPVDSDGLCLAFNTHGDPQHSVLDER